MGRNRPVPVVLLSVDPHAWSQAEDTGALPPEALRQIGQDIEAATKPLAPAQRPAGALITRRSFGIASGELTANLKLKRNVIEAQYAAEVERLFGLLAQQPTHRDCLVLEAA